MSTISTSGIAPNSIIRSEHLLRIINALSNKENTDILISGSLSVTGSINGTYLGLGGNNNYSNIALGNSALFSNTTGYFNIATGYQALESNTTGSNNTATGFQALQNNTTGFANTATGNRALSSNVIGTWNVAIGSRALELNTTGKSNTVVGEYGMPINTAGQYNVSLGTNSLWNNTVGEWNTAVGTLSLPYNTTGNFNVGVGSLAGSGSISGEKNIFIGHNTSTSYISGSNQIVIGADAQSKGPNTITLGNSSITGLYCNVQTITSLSDQRDKSEIRELTLGIDFIKELKPVTYTWTRRDGTFEGVKDIGFIAQELDETEQKFNSEDITRLVDKKDPEKYYADYLRTYPILVKAVQELAQQVENLQNELNLLKK